MRAAFEQARIDPEFACFRDAPGQHALAAHAITEHCVAFDDQDTGAGRCHGGGECGTSQSTADDHQIVVYSLLP